MTPPIDSVAPPAGRKAAFAFIFAACLMDIIALGIIIPVLPRLVQGFVGGDTRTAAHYMGVFGTIWALMHFFAAPILGALSDRFGRRPVLLVSIFGLGLDYIVMALAPTLWWLLLGRVISGFTSGSLSTAAAYVADITPPEQRAKRFGMIGAAVGAGFVVGPALGGLLGNVDPRLPFWVAAVLALLNGCYGLFVLPESLPKANRSPFRWAKANPLGSFELLRSHPGLLGLAMTYFLYMLAQQVMPTTFNLYTGYRFGWSAQAVGIYLGLMGLSSILVQAVFVGPAVKRLGERGAMLLGLTCGVVGYILFATAKTGPMFYLGAPVFALMGLCQAGYQGLMTSRVSPREQGRLQGANSAIMGLAGMIGPSVFTFTFAWAIGPGQPMHVPSLAIFLAAGLLIIALGLAYRFSRRPPRATAAPA